MQYTEANDVIELYKLLEENGIEVWIDGGWSVDALLGRQTRPHKDLDIAVQHKNLLKLRELLEVRGYKEITGDGVINDYTVKCISLEWVIKFHSNHKLDEKDIQDIKALVNKFGIKPPKNYKN